ncbi:MAG: cation diffusion facilitator family transporter [Kiritimatiellae bacterium]|nr:cation diffusion facilitator family transporter [Kiritimatiellia bacterium]
MVDSAPSPDPGTPARLRGWTGWLIRRVLGDGHDPAETAARQRLGEFEGFLSASVSLALAAAKAVLGLWSGSISLIADAVNNSADVASSLVIALSCRWARRPGDRRHPFGHGRLETVATLVLSFFLLAVALQVGAAGVRRLWRPEPAASPGWLLIAVSLTIGLKSALAHFARTAARLSRSSVIEADSWNHLFDIAATSLVFVALLGNRLGHPRLDGWAAIGVAAFIAGTGVRFARSALSALIGESVDDAQLARIRSLAASVHGVRGVHDVLVHSYGDARLISLHIEVDAALTLMEAHAMAEEVERRIAQATGAKVVAHTDPVDRAHPEYEAARRSLDRYAHDHADVAGFHDLRLTGPAGGADLSVDIVLHAEDRRRGEHEVSELRDRLCERLRRDVPGLRRIDLGFETESGATHEERRSYPP